MHNVILIGMPGVGKSTLGVLLAKTLGMTFLDTDLVIQDQKKALLRELIAQHGIDGFLALEGTVCAGLQAENAVIATGGGIVKHKVNMDYLRQNGIVFFIDRSLDKLITTDDNRPLSSSAQAVARMYEERIELYRKYADHIVDNNTTIDACAERITEILNR